MSGEPTEPLEPAAPGDGDDTGGEFNASNRAHVKSRAREARVLEGRVDNALKVLMSHKDGRLLVWRWLQSCRLFQISYTPGDDVGSVAFNEGHRNVGLQWMLKLGNLCPDHFALMQKENAP